MKAEVSRNNLKCTYVDHIRTILSIVALEIAFITNNSFLYVHQRYPIITGS